MKRFKSYLDEKGRCWPGHRPVPGKKPYSPGSCTKEETVIECAVDDLKKQLSNLNNSLKLLKPTNKNYLSDRIKILNDTFVNKC